MPQILIFALLVSIPALSLPKNAKYGISNDHRAPQEAQKAEGQGNRKPSSITSCGQNCPCPATTQDQANTHTYASLRATDVSPKSGNGAFVISCLAFAVSVASALFAWRQTTILATAERAWVMVKLEGGVGYGTTVSLGSTRIGDAEIFTTNASFRLLCFNNGKTPAWITEKRAALVVASSLPKKPDLTSTIVIQSAPEPLQVGVDTYTDFSLRADDQEDGARKLYVYGVVRYMDAFGDKRQTTFGYRFRQEYPLARIDGKPEYNKNT